jgi:hypothetical protein
VEELAVESAFEGLDALAEAGLGAAEELGCCADGSGVGDGDEGVEQDEVHGVDPFVRVGFGGAIRRP